ncbi:hypothetical protein AC579_7854 [Pseudocercospora musae]|uniref:Uncharacterized protein n=1 Tax=Pseudocercospora musae TaxID=113226 RepID=A0A139HZ51_9PEZI|nr:hypothetical protein AC579_7854 [Pseudocercospora musae]
MPSSRLRFPTTFRRIRSPPPVTTMGSEERVLETPDLVSFSRFFANDEEIEEALSDPLITLDFDVGGVGPTVASVPGHAIEQKDPPRFQVASSDSGEDSVLPTPEKPCDMPASSPPIPKSTSSHDSGIEIPSSPSLNARSASRSSPHPGTEMLGQAEAKPWDVARDIEAQTEAGVNNADVGKSAECVSDSTRASTQLDSVTLPRMIAAAAFLVPEMEESHLAAAVRQVQTWSDEKGGLNILINTILAKAANAEETKLFRNFVRDAETYLIAQGKLGKMDNEASSLVPEYNAVVVDDATKGKQDRQLGISSQTPEGQTETRKRKNDGTPNSTSLPASSQLRSLQDQVDKSISHVLDRAQLDKALAIWQIHRDALYNHDVRDLLEKFLQSRASRDESQRFKALLKEKQDRFKIQKKSPKRKMPMVSRYTQTRSDTAESPQKVSKTELISVATQTEDLSLGLLAQPSDSLNRPLAEPECMEAVPGKEKTINRHRSAQLMDDGQQGPREDSEVARRKREYEPDSQPDLVSTPEGGPSRNLRNSQRKRQKREEDARKVVKYLMQTEDGIDSQLYLDLLERSEQGRERRDSSAAKIASRRLHAALSDSSSVCESAGTPRSTPIALPHDDSRSGCSMDSPTSATNNDTSDITRRTIDRAPSSPVPSYVEAASSDASSPHIRESERNERSSEARCADSGAATARICTSGPQEGAHSVIDAAPAAQPLLLECGNVPSRSSTDTSEVTSRRSTTITEETYNCTYVVDKEKVKDSQSTFAALKPAAPSPPNIASPPRSPQLLHCKRCDYHAYGSGDHSRYCHGYRALRRANKSARRLEDRLRKQAAVSASASTLAQDEPEARRKNTIVETEEETYRIATARLGQWNVRRGSLAYNFVTALVTQPQDPLLIVAQPLLLANYFRSPVFAAHLHFLRKHQAAPHTTPRSRNYQQHVARYYSCASIPLQSRFASDAVALDMISGTAVFA